MSFFLFLLGFAMVETIIGPVGKLLAHSGIIRENYRGDAIPTALGIIFPLTIPLPLICLLLRIGSFIAAEIFILLFFTTGMGLLGFCDDLLKTDEEKGFRGHFSQLIKGNLTSGGLKAIVGLLFGLIFAFGLWLIKEYSWYMVFFNGLLVALSANSMNLFDLRPGRAVKFFFFTILLLSTLLWFSGGGRSYLLIFAPVCGGVLSYLPWDLKAQAMLGDTGANFLGALVGAVVVLSRDSVVIWFFFTLIIILQFCAEKYSLSQIIKSNQVLRFLDELGRD